MQAEMAVDVWSDVVCPWCYLGKRRLDAALRLVPFGESVVVRWRAFQLDPQATAEPAPLRGAIERKYGPGAYDGMVGRLVPLGAEVGIDYRFDDVKRVASVDALRLCAWAGSTVGHAVADRLHERLFEAYFSDGGNIADHDALAGWAEEVGIDGSAVRTALAGDAGRDAVIADIAEAREREVTGVPAFLVGGMAMIPGAQDVETMVMVLTRMWKRLHPEPAA